MGPVRGRTPGRQARSVGGDGADPAAGKHQRFEALALAHVDRLYRYALRLAGQAAEAEDLVQQTYLHAWRAFDETSLAGDARSWLFRILTNLFISRYRRKRREPKLVDFQENPSLSAAAGPPGDAEPSPASARLDEHLDQRVKAALDSLSPDFRSVILLAAVEGLSYDEIAQACNIPIGTVMSRLHRSRRQLRDRLRQYAAELGYDSRDE